MKKNGLVILLVALCASFSTLVFAETIVLKSGSTVEGKIIEKTDKYIKIDFQGVVLTYAFDEIERIDEENKISLTPSDKIERIDEENKISLTPSEINKAYYSPIQLGLKKFRCEVTSSSFDMIKDMYCSKSLATGLEKKVLNSIKFYLKYDPKVADDVTFSFNSTLLNPTGYREFDLMVQQSINDVRDSLLDLFKYTSFCTIWYQIITGDFMETPSEYVIEKLPDGYCISYENYERSFKVFTDNQLLISEIVKIDRVHGTSKIKVYFMNTKQGFLLQRYEGDLDDGSQKYVVTIDYQQWEGFQMPKLAVIQDSRLGVSQSFKLKFFNFEIAQ